MVLKVRWYLISLYSTLSFILYTSTFKWYKMLIIFCHVLLQNYSALFLWAIYVSYYFRKIIITQTIFLILLIDITLGSCEVFRKLWVNILYEVEVVWLTSVISVSLKMSHENYECRYIFYLLIPCNINPNEWNLWLETLVWK